MHYSYVTPPIVDDEYLLQLQQQLFQMKQQRKQSEKDAAVLNSRVRCLKQEQTKTLKRIELTKQKTRQKTMSIERIRRAKQEKENINKQKQDEIMRLKQKNLERKYRTLNNIQIQKENQIMKNKEDNRNQKEQQKQNEYLSNSLIHEQQQQRRNIASFIKGQRDIKEQKKIIADIEKKKTLKNDLELKIQNELEIKEENDKAIQLLLQEEKDLMENIESIQNKHMSLIENFQQMYFYSQQDEYINNGDINEENYLKQSGIAKSNNTGSFTQSFSKQKR